MIKAVSDGKKQNERESQRIIKAFWKFCHGEYYKNEVIDYDEKEYWFIDNHEDFDEQGFCDDYMYSWSW